MKLSVRSCLFCILWFNSLVIIPVSAQKSEGILPLKRVPLLSGNFGELRATHFHSGVDLKTGGVIGVPVLCAKDGVVARVRISPVGYGNALYIEHPDGTTSVYGHLSRFRKEIREIARRFQYEQESFEIDEAVKNYRLFFRKGDTIAYSGNTGSSGGPHLHFEYRNTFTEMVLNPLHFLKIRDHLPPRFRTLYFYAVDSVGRLELLKREEVRRTENGGYFCPVVSVPAGKIGIGSYITDAMNDSWNKLGIYRLIMRVNGEERFRMTVDSIAFDSAPLINGLKDYHLYRDKGETVYRCFGNYLHRLPGIVLKEKGWIAILQGEEIQLELEAQDINGNRSLLTCRIKGGMAKPVKVSQVLKPGQPYRLQAGRFSLQLDSCSLFTAVDRLAVVDSLGCFVVAQREEPLYAKALLRVRGTFGEKELLVRMTDKGKTEAMKTGRESTGLFCRISVLGSYAVVEDTVPPTVEYLGLSGRDFCFRVKDELSGIASYRGEIDGEWCLFSYDAKRDMLSCSKNEPGFTKGRHRLVLTVKDEVGNETRKEIVVSL